MHGELMEKVYVKEPRGELRKCDDSTLLYDATRVIWEHGGGLNWLRILSDGGLYC
jgi:hypothetical protein